jgi:hypothetical protein
MLLHLMVSGDDRFIIVEVYLKISHITIDSSRGGFTCEG